MNTQQQVGKPAQAGKGSRPRPVRGSTYRNNYAAIRWKKRKRNKMKMIIRKFGPGEKDRFWNGVILRADIYWSIHVALVYRLQLLAGLARCWPDKQLRKSVALTNLEETQQFSKTLAYWKRRQPDSLPWP
jgi:hypothetical protein